MLGLFKDIYHTSQNLIHEKEHPKCLSIFISQMHLVNFFILLSLFVKEDLYLQGV